MRRTLSGVEVALSEAMARVAAIYAEIPEASRPDVTGERWAALEADVDRAGGSGDRDAALLAIERWEQHARRVLSHLAGGRGDG